MAANSKELTYPLCFKMKALIAAGKDYDKINEDTLIAAWLEEYNAGKKKYGKGRQGHGAIQYVASIELDSKLSTSLSRFYFENTSTLEEIRKNQSKKVCPGNAPSMRVIPFCTISKDVNYLHYQSNLIFFLKVFCLKSR